MCPTAVSRPQRAPVSTSKNPTTLCMATHNDTKTLPYPYPYPYTPMLVPMAARSCPHMPQLLSPTPAHSCPARHPPVTVLTRVALVAIMDRPGSMMRVRPRGPTTSRTALMRSVGVGSTSPLWVAATQRHANDIRICIVSCGHCRAHEAGQRCTAGECQVRLSVGATKRHITTPASRTVLMKSVGVGSTSPLRVSATEGHDKDEDLQCELWALQSA